MSREAGSLVPHSGRFTFPIVRCEDIVLSQGFKAALNDAGVSHSQATAEKLLYELLDMPEDSCHDEVAAV